MNFYIVFVKNRKKLDKYIKINKIRSKTIIDIKQQLDEHGLEGDISEWKDYFNFMIYTKITQTIKKNKHVYYIPNLNKLQTLDINDIFHIKNNLNDIQFNLLFFFEDFKDTQIYYDIIDNISLFDAIQIIRDY